MVLTAATTIWTTVSQSLTTTYADDYTDGRDDRRQINGGHSKGGDNDSDSDESGSGDPQLARMTTTVTIKTRLTGLHFEESYNDTHTARADDKNLAKTNKTVLALLWPTKT